MSYCENKVHDPIGYQDSSACFDPAEGESEKETSVKDICRTRDASPMYAKNTELVRRASEGDEKALEELVLSNMGLVRSIARKFIDRGTDYEDLVQIGIMGMLKAAESFDINRGTVFSTYAVPLIVGEIRRHLRDDGMIKVSRQYKRLGMALSRERHRILTEEGREPRIEELAALCSSTPEECAMALEAISPVSSFSDTVGGDESMTLESTLADADSEAEIERINDRLALNQAISKMQPTWRKIVLLRYYRGKTQQETADLLGLSQVKVSREEKKIMEFLRGELVV